MFARLFPRRTPDPKPLPQPDAQLALGALLVRVAFADRTYMAALLQWLDCGAASLLFKENGPHLPGIGLKSTVFILEKN